MSDIGYLLTKKPKLDKHYRPKTEYEKKLIYCTELSIGQTEFYQGQSVGLKPEIKLEAVLIELNNATHFEYKGKIYKILRTFKKGDKVEITLTSTIIDNE